MEPDDFKGRKRNDPTSLVDNLRDLEDAFSCI
jgi:hypothetical protein